METLSQEAQDKLMKGWLNERQWRLYVATEARRIGPGGIRKARPRGRSHPQNDPQRPRRTGSRSALSAGGADRPTGRWQEKEHRQGRHPASRFGREARPARRSREPPQIDDQVGKQVEESPHAR